MRGDLVIPPILRLDRLRLTTADRPEGFALCSRSCVHFPQLHDSNRRSARLPRRGETRSILPVLGTSWGAAMSSRRVLVTGITGQDGWYLTEILQSDGAEVVGLVRPGSRDADASERGSRRRRPRRSRIVCAQRCTPLRHTRSTTSPRRPSSPPRGRTRPGRWTPSPAPPARCWPPPRAERAAAVSSSPPARRSSATPASRRSTSPRRCARARPTAWPSSPRTASSGRSARRGLYACAGILYNHESPRRPERFVTRKITAGAAAIASGRLEELALGDLDAVRDWSHARDVVRGAVLALRHDEPGDYVFASGVGHTVGDWVDAAFAAAGDRPGGQASSSTRPSCARPSRGRWSATRPRPPASSAGSPRSAFADLVAEMVRADLGRLAT